MIVKNILVALLLVLAYNLVFFKTGFGLGFALFILFINSAFYFFTDPQSKNKTPGKFASAVSVLFAFLTVFRANELILVINGMAAVFFELVALYFYKGLDEFTFKIPDFILAPVITFFKGVDSIFKLFSPQTFQDEKVDSQIFKSVAKGVLIAIPVLAVLLFLLTQADPVFSKITGDILSNSFERTLFSALVFVGMLCLSLVSIRNRESSTEQSVHSHKGYELTVLLSSVAVLFGLFIAVQFQYLFSQTAEHDLAELGVSTLTYSEYVRKGFFELMTATVITGGILMYVLSNVFRMKDKQRVIVQTFSSVVVLETLMLIVSAAQRVNLYQLEHGLTRARVFGFIFYVYLAVFLVLLMIQILKRMGNKPFFVSHVLLGLASLLTVNVLNVDGLIAKDYKPTVNGETDYYYISSLSPDAHEAWDEILTDAENFVTSAEALPELSSDDLRRLLYISDSVGFLGHRYTQVGNKKWQEFNITRNAAYTAALENDLLRRVDEIKLRVEALNKKASGKARENIRLDRDTSPPLVR